MGKGDKKTKRGKILMGSHGVRRPRRKVVHALPAIALKEELPVKVQKEKPVAKPKAEKEEITSEAPVVEVISEVAEKPAKKKAPPKAKSSANNADKPE